MASNHLLPLYENESADEKAERLQRQKLQNAQSNHGDSCCTKLNKWMFHNPRKVMTYGTMGAMLVGMKVYGIGPLFVNNTTAVSMQSNDDVLSYDHKPYEEMGVDVYDQSRRQLGDEIDAPVQTDYGLTADGMAIDPMDEDQGAVSSRRVLLDDYVALAGQLKFYIRQDEKLLELIITVSWEVTDGYQYVTIVEMKYNFFQEKNVVSYSIDFGLEFGREKPFTLDVVQKVLRESCLNPAIVADNDDAMAAEFEDGRTWSIKLEPDSDNSYFVIPQIPAVHDDVDPNPKFDAFGKAFNDKIEEDLGKALDLLEITVSFATPDGEDTVTNIDFKYLYSEPGPEKPETEYVTKSLPMDSVYESEKFGRGYVLWKLRERFKDALGANGQAKSEEKWTGSSWVFALRPRGTRRSFVIPS